jgi:Fe-S-cluster containining protein
LGFDSAIPPGRRLKYTMPIFSGQDEKNLYIQKVWERLESKYLHIYPFLTDHEFNDLFGEKVLNAIAALNCPQDKCGLCDTDIDCPFYSTRLDRCGIDPYKPVHCRLWHCYECGPGQIVKDLRELTAVFADHMGSETKAREIKKALERAELSADGAIERFVKLIQEFRNEAPRPETICSTIRGKSCPALP